MKPAEEVALQLYGDVLDFEADCANSVAGCAPNLREKLTTAITQARKEGAEDMHERLGGMIKEAERRVRFDAALTIEGFAERYDGTTEMKEAILALPLDSESEAS